MTHMDRGSFNRCDAFMMLPEHDVTFLRAGAQLLLCMQEGVGVKSWAVWKRKRVDVYVFKDICCTLPIVHKHNHINTNVNTFSITWTKMGNFCAILQIFLPCLLSENS